MVDAKLKNQISSILVTFPNFVFWKTFLVALLTFHLFRVGKTLVIVLIRFPFQKENCIV